MSARFGRSFVMGCGVLVVVCGCAKGQTGGEIGVTTSNTDGEVGGCKDGPSTTLSPDEQIPGVDFKLSDLIEQIEGEHETSFAWRAADDASFENVVVTPEAGLTTLRIEVNPLPETGRLVERVAQQDSVDGQESTLNDGYAACTARVMVDAEVTVESDNGALDETFSATFWSSDGVVAHSEIEADPPQWGGNFSVDVSELGDNAEASQTRMEFALAFGALSGSLGGLVTTNNGEVATAGGITYARFPAETECESGYLLPADDPLREAVQQLLDAHTEFDFTWQGEAAQDLTIETTLGAICYNDQDVGYGLGFTAQVESAVRLADDTIDGTWPLSAVITQDEEGALARVDVQRQGYMTMSYEPAEFEEQTGIHGVTTDADGLSFSFGFAVEDIEGARASGELTLLELTSAQCDEKPDEPLPEEGGGSPGCRGTDAAEIRNAQFIESAQ